jgi:methyl-accepting chemotaxis protein
MTIKMKLLGGGGVICFLLLCVLLIAVYSFGNLSSGFSKIVEKSTAGVENSRKSKVEVTTVSANLSGISSEMLHLVEDINNTNMNVKVLERKIKELSSTLNELTEEITFIGDEFPDGLAKDTLEDVTDSVGDIEEVMRRETLVSLVNVVAKMKSFTDNVNKQVTGINQLSEDLNKVNTLSTDVAVANKSINELSQDFEGEIRLSKNSMFLVLLVTIFICIIGSVLLIRTITKPLKNVSIALKNISEGEGDLTKRLNLKSQDEIGMLANSFDLFVDKIQFIVSNTKKVAMSLKTLATEVEVLSKESSESLDSEKGQLHLVVTAMTEMSATSKDVAKHVDETSIAAQKANENAQNGSEVVQNTIKVISELKEEIVNVSESITELSNNSKNVGSVVEVIDSIAAQTNLLALNAAIEAARAGEQGRGFAVVADEVRSLAARTQQSTQEIREKIDELQDSANKSVIMMQSSKTKTEQGVVEAAHVGDSINTIIEGISVINDMSVQIATAADEQSCVAVEMDENLISINNAVDSTSDVADKSLKSANELVEMSLELEGLIGKFVTE